MPRIPALPADQAGWLVRRLYGYARRRFGAVPEPFAVMAHHRPVMLTAALGETALERAARHLPASLADLVVYRVATELGCSWCVDFGTMLQRHKGLDLERLRHLDGYADSDRFTETEKLALAYADAVTATPVRATDEQVARLRELLGDKGLVELTYLITVENQRARFNDALGIVDQGFTSGEACRVPLPVRTEPA
ncbi:alkylhydroperoxidase family enzyme [Crossiella equi]|uniref:Alkylhydroperoxidase family enzyme n=1 Tax=Crossiella equi TaxID=130796 RepID=A0ABS5ACX2_9PSEU|nr:carboxymuconolactone decarboxylase family protein [Crossiella equi]MBP2474054.1 alkylhydroperoxidase family enzyme [Crossiella equi]